MIRSVIIGLFLIIAFSCKKDGEVYTQEQLNGTWQSSENNSFDCIQQLEIADTVLSEIKICMGIPAKFKAKNYSFTGKVIRYDLYGLKFEFEISALTDEKLLLGYHDPVEYFRVSK
jgi:hypothetical protein